MSGEGGGHVFSSFQLREDGASTPPSPSLGSSETAGREGGRVSETQGEGKAPMELREGGGQGG